MRYLYEFAKGNPWGFGLLALFALWISSLIFTVPLEAAAKRREEEDRDA